MSSIEFLITTFDRQASCQRLVDNLQGLGDILVVNDGCNYKITGCNQVILSHHYGRAGYWRVVEALFSMRGRSDYFIMLPDDFLFPRESLQRALDLWNSIRDPYKICLNLYNDVRLQGCWTGIKPQDVGSVRLTQWVDMCFVCEKAFFSAVEKIKEPAVSPSYFSRRGSGVGSRISRGLLRQGYNMYQVKDVLVIPQEEHCESKMLPKWNESVVSRRSRKGKRLFKL